MKNSAMHFQIQPIQMLFGLEIFGEFKAHFLIFKENLYFPHNLHPCNPLKLVNNTVIMSKYIFYSMNTQFDHRNSEKIPFDCFYLLVLGDRVSNFQKKFRKRLKSDIQVEIKRQKIEKSKIGAVSSQIINLGYH